MDQPPPYFVFVRFEDSKKTPHVVPSLDIRDFSPAHSSDFDKSKTYYVCWQAAEGSFDGFFPAKIICIGASLLELKENATALNIKRLPPNFYTMIQGDKHREDDEQDKDECEDVKQTRKASASDEKKSKKKRSMNVLAEIGQNNTDAKRTRKSSPAPNNCFLSPVESEGVGSPLKVKVKKQSSRTGTESGSPQKSLIEKSPSKKSPAKTSSLNASPGKAITTAQPANGSPELSKPTIMEEPPSNTVSDDDYDISRTVTLPLSMPTPRKQSGSESSDSSDSLSDSSDSSSGSSSSSASSQKVESDAASAGFSDFSRSDSCDSNIVLMSQVESLRAACKLSEKSRLECYEQLQKLKEDMAKIEDRMRTLENENQTLKLENEQLRKDKMKHSVSRNILQDFPEEVDGEKQLDAALTPKSEKKIKMPRNKSDWDGLSQDEIVKISHEVRDDLLGTKLLPTNSSGKICLGENVAISKDKWTKSIKLQSKNSLFVTKLSQAVYGSQQLSVRTVGTPKESDKQRATPKKVDTVVACLRGKILAQHPDFPEVDKAALAAKSILARKMQDEAKALKKEGESKRKRSSEEQVKKRESKAHDGKKVVDKMREREDEKGVEKKEKEGKKEKDRMKVSKEAEQADKDKKKKRKDKKKKKNSKIEKTKVWLDRNK